MRDNGSRIGNYEIVEFLGRGQSVVTYRAIHLLKGHEVALKVPHANLASDTTFYFRFFREAALCSRLDHPNIVRVLDSGEAGEDLFIAMELVDGAPLDNELARIGPLNLIRSLKLASQLAGALGYAHNNGVIHRNLKPGHIMVLPDDSPKILDFGVARDFGQTGLTSSGVYLGTPQYSAPEASEPRQLDHTSDLYSLGIILFEMLEGRPPYQSQSPVEVMMMHTSQEFPRPETLKVKIPAAVWDLINRLCSKVPANRPRSGAEVSREIDRIAELLGRLNEAR